MDLQQLMSTRPGTMPRAGYFVPPDKNAPTLGDIGGGVAASVRRGVADMLPFGLFERGLAVPLWAAGGGKRPYEEALNTIQAMYDDDEANYGPATSMVSLAGLLFPGGAAKGVKKLSAQEQRIAAEHTRLMKSRGFEPHQSGVLVKPATENAPMEVASNVPLPEWLPNRYLTHKVLPTWEPYNTALSTGKKMMSFNMVDPGARYHMAHIVKLAKEAGVELKAGKAGDVRVLFKVEHTPSPERLKNFE